MSRLYDALTALERKAHRITTTALPAPPAEARRRYRWPAIALIAVVVCGASALTIVPRGRSTALPAAPLPAAPSAAPPQVRVPGLRERAREAAMFGSLEQAEELLQQAVRLAPADAVSWNDLGVVLVRRAQTRRGIEAFERSVAVDPRNAATHRNLAVALDRDGKAAAAVEHYRAFLALAPEHPERARVEERLAGTR